MESIKECEEYLLNIPKFKKKTLLSDTLKFYEILGAPAKDIPKIHVAGTNGKGSTCFYISRILEAHGKRTGLFTSPHLVSVKERFVFSGEMITDEEFILVFNKVRATCELFDDEEKITMHPSFFEFLFLMFMEWMSIKKADVIVLETGLGGMLDATNIFSSPSVCVICSIGKDHIEQLGNTIEEIAVQKAGIIKKNVPLVFWDNGAAVNEIIEKTAAEKNCETFLLCEKNIKNVKYDKKHIAFSLNINYDNIDFVRDLSVWLPTGAVYQRINSSLALVAAKVFLKDEYDDNTATEALVQGNFKGRFDEIAPGFFVDGAHNENSIPKFLESVSVRTGKKVLIFGACADKNYEKMLEMITGSNLFETIILTKIDSSRAVEPKVMAECLKEDGFLLSDSLPDAVRKAEGFGCDTYIVGSLYLAGEAIAYFTTEKN
ncbi:MAG: bifunctional folylpolyglutamate synthase/dihydrofolate synthase [Lachnospiraceae bacterium]|nr:bifunctional folylpolyglutamate synthase/dihydrofolate synthase [Lachnospiraceae bacterium]